mgnify:CR=1 FL=1
MNAAEPAPFTQQVRDMDFASAAWYAATDRGLHVSRDRGRTWSAPPGRALTVSVLAMCALSGLYTSAWGAYKDGPWEGFRRHTFPRAIRHP